jgi:adenylate cyclase
MRPRLVLQPGSSEEQIIDLPHGTTTIGRSRENAVCIPHKSLSRAHAVIEVGEGRVVVGDLGSKNGTFVDGVQIERKVLEGTHQLKFGDITARYAREVAFDTAVSPRQPTLARSLAGDLTRVPLRQILGSTEAVPSLRGLQLKTPAGVDRDRDKLRILLKVSQILSTPGPLEALLSSVLDLAFEILDIDRAAVFMLDRAGMLEPRVVRTRSGKADNTVVVSRSIASYALERNEAVLFSDAAADPRLAAAGSIALQSIRTSMCAPLKPRDAVLGVLYVDNTTHPDRFGEEDLDFLSGFASQAAVAIENALLSEKLAAEAVSRNNLLRFFPPAAVPVILGQGDAGLAVIETEATALFSDISGYTELASHMKPVEVIELLNAYFPPMAEIVFRYEGTLEKYIGDALLAIWGAPLRHEDDAVRAVRAAIEMQRAIRSINEALGGRHQLGIHIGINTGLVAAGNIGSKDYIQYATIGDATNVASRICGVARNGEIVVDEVTAERVGRVGVRTTALDKVQLKGKEEPLALRRVEWEPA